MGIVCLTKILFEENDLYTTLLDFQFGEQLCLYTEAMYTGDSESVMITVPAGKVCRRWQVQFSARLVLFFSCALTQSIHLL